jgi:hypothetical protein
MRTLLALAALGTCASPLAGQSLGEVCRGLADRMTVGSWSEYRMSGPQGPMQMRFAVIGKEAVAGQDYIWFELKMGSTQGTMIVQALVPGFPYDQDKIESMVMKMGDQPAMKMPKSMLGMAGQAMRGQNPAAGAGDALKKCESAELIGRETIQVPAGQFQTLHFRSTEAGQKGEGWVSQDVPMGIVKMIWEASGGSPGGDMVLLGHGKDAKSSITETPQEMPGMPRR